MTTTITGDAVSSGGFSQAGSPVVESGSNADGSWTKWADGTMICYGLSPLDYLADTAHGVVYVNTDPIELSFPIPFIEPPIISPFSRHVSGQARITWAGATTPPTETLTGGLFIISPITSTTGRYRVGYIAKGRWKA